MPIDQELAERIDLFIRELKQGTVKGSYTVAYGTLQLLRKIIAQAKWKNASEIIAIIKDEGRKLIDAQLCEMATKNMICRVLKIIHEECFRSGKGESEDKSHPSQKMYMTEGMNGDEFIKQEFPNFKASVIEAVNELITELETSRDNIATQALQHIHANEVILTAGKSSTVEAFLKRAAKKRKFQVIVVECAPTYHGQDLALSLATAGIETVVISDSAVFSMMSRVNKVIIGTHTVLANGGLKAISGSHAVALAAKYYAVPMIVCASMFKLSQEHICLYDQENSNKFLSPQDILPFSEGKILSKVQIYNPVFDYVPPELVTLVISNVGGNATSYIYRLVSDIYSVDDLF